MVDASDQLTVVLTTMMTTTRISAMMKRAMVTTAMIVKMMMATMMWTGKMTVMRNRNATESSMMHVPYSAFLYSWSNHQTLFIHKVF